MELNFNSVDTTLALNASAAFKVDSGKVFKEDVDIVPVIIDETLSYVPWGGDNGKCRRNGEGFIYSIGYLKPFTCESTN